MSLIASCKHSSNISSSPHLLHYNPKQAAMITSHPEPSSPSTWSPSIHADLSPTCSAKLQLFGFFINSNTLPTIVRPFNFLQDKRPKSLIRLIDPTCPAPLCFFGLNRYHSTLLCHLEPANFPPIILQQFLDHFLLSHCHADTSFLPYHILLNYLIKVSQPKHYCLTEANCANSIGHLALCSCGCSFALQHLYIIYTEACIKHRCTF